MNRRAQQQSAMAQFGVITALNPPSTQLNTGAMFAAPRVAQHRELSAIDEFIENANQLHITVGQHPSFDRHFGALMLLGYVSAVESYIRRLIVSVVEIDQVAQDLVADSPIPFGTTLCTSNSRDFAEALLDPISLASKRRVVEALKDYLGIKRAGVILEERLDDFQAICEARHCCVHRFGRLGAKNAIALGLDVHGNKLGGPFSITQTEFEDLAVRLRTLVKGINNCVWEQLLERTARNSDDQGRRRLYAVDWTWNWNRDRRRFESYWRMFATVNDAAPSPRAFQLYNSFRHANTQQARGSGGQRAARTR